MTEFMLVLAILVFCYTLFRGISALADPDGEWELRVRRFQRYGLSGPLERAPHWDRGTKTRAIVGIVLSLVSLGLTIWVLVLSLGS